MNRIEQVTIKEMVSNNMDISNCLGFTGDLKKCIKNDRFKHYIDDIKVVQNTTRFLNYLNYKIYKNSFRRHSKRLKVVPVVEGGWSSNIRFHIHLVMEYPDTKIISNSDFNLLLLRCWYKTFYRYDHPHIHTKTDLGWVGYMTKFYEKDDFVDWVNVTI